MHAYYDLDAEGADAAAIFARLGWTAERAPASLRAGGDLLVFGDSSVARIWHTQCAYATTPMRIGDPRRYRAALIVEGSGECTVAGVSSTFEPGVLLIHDATLPAALDASAPVAAIHLTELWSQILPAGVASDDIPFALRPPERHAALLTAMVNASFENRDIESGLGFSSWLAAINSGMSMLLSGAGIRSHEAMQTSSLFDRVAALVGERYADPEFGPSAIVDHLGVSPSRLHRALAERGTTPRRLLQQTRARHAQALLPQLATPAEVAAVALTTGFGTARALRRALREERAHLG